MLKGNFFSISRFMNLCRKDTVESAKTHLLRIVALYGAMVIFFVWRGYIEYIGSRPSLDYDSMVHTCLYTFLWVGVLGGCISASLNMEKMKSRMSRLSILMVPASPFEKFFSRWLISTVAYMLVFLIAFKLADYTRVLVYSIALPDQTIAVADLKYLFTTEGNYILSPEMSGEYKILFFFIYLFFQSCFILGSSIWPKNSLVKTLTAGLVVIILTSVIIAGVAKLVIGQSFVDSRVVDEGFIERNITTIAFCVVTFFTLLNWVLAYYRFKESEIINRL